MKKGKGLLKALKQLRTHRTLLLTGSPLQNNIEEFEELILHAFASESTHHSSRVGWLY